MSELHQCDAFLISLAKSEGRNAQASIQSFIRKVQKQISFVKRLHSCVLFLGGEEARGAGMGDQSLPSSLFLLDPPGSLCCVVIFRFSYQKLPSRAGIVVYQG